MAEPDERPITDKLPEPVLPPAEDASPASETPVVVKPAAPTPSSEVLPSYPGADAPTNILPPAAAFPQVGERIAGFALEARLGGGGMGTVFQGRHETLGTRAIKVMLMGGHNLAARRERFAREARSLARLDAHPHVVRVHQYGLIAERAGLAYCVLDFVEGGDLADALEEGRLPVERAIRLASGIANALEHIHAAGIVHRDLKPANVLLREESDQPCLTDFGLARDSAEERITATGQVMGTLNYMAPEQVAGQHDLIGPQTDVYALGTILFEMLSGELCHPGVTPDVMFGILNGRVARVRSHNPDVPPALDDLVAACLEKDPADRPTASEVFDELGRIQAGEGGALGRSPAQRFVRGVSRRRVGVSLGLLLLAGSLLLIASSGVSRPRPRPLTKTTTQSLPARVPTAGVSRPYQAAERALQAGDIAAATSRSIQAVRSHPNAPARSALVDRAKQHLGPATSWTEDDPAGKLREAAHEVAVHRLLHVLLPGHRIPKPRLEAMRALWLKHARTMLPDAVKVRELLQAVEWLLEVNPDYLPAYQVLVLALRRSPPRQRVVLKSRIGLALKAGIDGEEGRLLATLYGSALLGLKDEVGLVELVAEARRGKDRTLVVELIVLHALLKLSEERFQACQAILREAERIDPRAPQPLLVRYVVNRKLKEDPAALRAGRAFLDRLEGIELVGDVVMKQLFLRFKLATWVAAQEQRLGNYAAAARAIRTLLVVVPDNLPWAVRRLRLLCRESPPDAQRVRLLREGLDDLKRRTRRSRRARVRSFDFAPLERLLAQGDVKSIDRQLRALEGALR